MKFAFVFPGQGSQALKMMDGLIELSQVKETFDEASEVLKEDFLSYLQEEEPTNINQTIITQPLMLIAGYATFLAWKFTNKDVMPIVMAGHSLGEWTALVASQVIEFKEALKLVKLRAKLMQEAVPLGVGSMAAVIGLDEELVIKACEEIAQSSNKIVTAANFNAIGQIVIAGERDAVEQASTLLKAKGARKIQILPVSIPSHCLLMRDASKKLEEALSNIPFNSPQIPVIHNYDANCYTDPNKIKEMLIKQLYSPVQWVKVINKILASTANIVECGPGKVLSGLNKRIDQNISSYNLHNITDLATVLSSLTSS